MVYSIHILPTSLVGIEEAMACVALELWGTMTRSVKVLVTSFPARRKGSCACAAIEVVVHGKVRVWLAA